MATKILLPITLCFLLVLATTHGKNDILAVVDFNGAIAQCKSNPSRIISNATLQLVINNATVGTVRTTNTGMISTAVNLTSSEQLASLTSNGGGKAFLVAPPHACGAPSVPLGQKVAAAVHTVTIIKDVAGLVQGVTTKVFAVIDQFACLALIW
ncbi:unnamed protein product [Urochloa humidicola]